MFSAVAVSAKNNGIPRPDPDPGGVAVCEKPSELVRTVAPVNFAVRDRVSNIFTQMIV